TDPAANLSAQAPRLPQEEAEGVSSQTRGEFIAHLFREHNESLVRFLALRLHSQQEAQEVAQEAYVRLLNLDRPGAAGFLRALLFKTAANLAIDRIRRQRTLQQSVQAGLFEEFRSTPTPEDTTASAQDLKLLEGLIRRLPPKCRRAFLLHNIDGLEFAEIAERMALGERMVRTYVTRAVLFCRAGLAAASTVSRRDD
ncbi:MAG: RNA polymerase sigma factor, partial [Steroidobacteraceae bacterium]